MSAFLASLLGDLASELAVTGRLTLPRIVTLLAWLLFIPGCAAARGAGDVLEANPARHSLQVAAHPSTTLPIAVASTLALLPNE